MRYYDLAIVQPASGRVMTVSQNGGFALGSASDTTFSSLFNGANNPGALDLEVDMPVYPWHVPQGKSYVRVYGVGLQMLGQSSDLNGYNFRLSGGMSKGFPLATPSQSGLLASGQIYQAFGNWEGTTQTLDLIVNPGGTDNQNISWNWPAGTQLSSALAQTFAQAFPQYQASINIGSIVVPGTETGTYTSLSAFAEYINDISVQYGTPVYGQYYPGVCITISGNTINAFDATAPTKKTTQLAFQDLIGQPTWIEPLTISFKTVLRSDLQVGSFVKFPPEVISPYVLTTDAAVFPNSPTRSRSIFQGSFFLREVHHFAHFRQASADAWVTAYLASPAPGVPG